MPESSLIDACPECGESNIAERTRKEPTYRCGICTARFAEPQTRKSREHARLTADDDTEIDETLSQVIEALIAIQNAGQSFVRSSQISAHIGDIRPQMVGRDLANHLEGVAVERWTENTSSTLWRITLEEGVDIADVVKA